MATVSARPIVARPQWQGLIGDDPVDAPRPDDPSNVRQVPVTGKITQPHRVKTPISPGRHAGPRTALHTPPLPIGESRRHDTDAGPIVSSWSPTRAALPPIDRAHQGRATWGRDPGRDPGPHDSAQGAPEPQLQPRQPRSSSTQPRPGKEHAGKVTQSSISFGSDNLDPDPPPDQPPPLPRQARMNSAQRAAQRTAGQRAAHAHAHVQAQQVHTLQQQQQQQRHHHHHRGEESDSHRVELLEDVVKKTTSTTRQLLEEALMAQSEIDTAWKQSAQDKRGEQDERTLLKQHIHSITQVVNKLSAELDSSEMRWRGEMKALAQGSSMQQSMLRQQVGSMVSSQQPVQAGMAKGMDALKDDINRTTAKIDTALREVQSNQGRFEQAIESLRRDVYGVQQKIETGNADRDARQRQLETMVQEAINVIRNEFQASLTETNLKLKTLEIHRLPAMCEHIYGQKMAGESEIPFAVDDKLTCVIRQITETFEQERSARQGDRSQLEDTMEDVRADGKRHKEELSVIIARMMQASSAHLQRTTEEQHRLAEDAAIAAQRKINRQENTLLHAAAGNDRVRKAELAGLVKRAELAESKIDTLTALLYAKTDSLEKQIQAGSFVIYTQSSNAAAAPPRTHPPQIFGEAKQK